MAPLPQSKRFMRKGVAKYYFAAAIANIHAVTRAELTSATEITDEVADTNGWSLENSPIPVPDMGTTFVKNIPGEDSAADSSLTFYDDKAGDDLDELLPKEQEGFIIIARKGDIPASLSLGCYPVRVGSKSPEFSAGNEPARTIVSFSITEEPELDGPVPAATP